MQLSGNSQEDRVTDNGYSRIAFFDKNQTGSYNTPETSSGQSMLTKKVVLISSDRAFQRRVLPGLMAVGTVVDAVESVESFLQSRLDPNLVLMHMSVESGLAVTHLDQLAGRLMRDGHIIVVPPRNDLPTIVQVMTRPQVSNVLMSEAAEPVTVASIAARHLFGDIFGLSKLMPWGVRIYSVLVSDYQEKSVAIATVADYASSMGIRRKYIENIEKVVDELLMNALYNAPLDPDGGLRSIHGPSEQKVGLPLEQKAVLQYASDGWRFAVGVRDNFGTLQKDVVLANLGKCIDSPNPVDRSKSGAGLGLYIVANSVSQLIFNLHPGLTTEVIGLFDLGRSRIQLDQLSIYTEKINPRPKNLEMLQAPAGGKEREKGLPQMSWFSGVSLLLAAVIFGAAAALLLYTRCF